MLLTMCLASVRGGAINREMVPSWRSNRTVRSVGTLGVNDKR